MRIYSLVQAGGTLASQYRPGNSTTRSRRSSWFILDNTPAALEIEPCGETKMGTSTKESKVKWSLSTWTESEGLLGLDNLEPL